jgi:hypothetical protein
MTLTKTLNLFKKCPPYGGHCFHYDGLVERTFQAEGCVQPRTYTRYEDHCCRCKKIVNHIDGGGW